MRSIPIAIVIAISPCAHGDVIFDRALFESMFHGLAIEDFEGIAPDDGIVQNPVLNGVTITSGTDGGVSWGVMGKDVHNTPSAAAFLFNADDKFTILLDKSVPVVGLNVSNPHFFDSFITGDVTVEVYDEDGNLLDSQTFATAPLSSMSTFVGFFGFSANIARIDVLDVPGFPGWPVIDDVQYGIPAPGALAVLALSMLIAPHRRRRQ